jgi:hypothetical protein
MYRMSVYKIVLVSCRQLGAKSQPVVPSAGVFLGTRAASVRGGWLANCMCVHQRPTLNAYVRTHRHRDLRNCKNSELGACASLSLSLWLGVRACGPGIDSNIWVNAPVACTHAAMDQRPDRLFSSRGRSTHSPMHTHTHKL